MSQDRREPTEIYVLAAAGICDAEAPVSSEFGERVRSASSNPSGHREWAVSPRRWTVDDGRDGGGRWLMMVVDDVVK